MSSPNADKSECKTVGRRCITLHKEDDLDQSEISQDAGLDIQDESNTIEEETFLGIQNSKDSIKKDTNLDVRKVQVPVNPGIQLDCNTERSKTYPCIYVTSLKPSIHEKVRSSIEENVIQSQVK